ncbi:cell division septal protein [Beggiatoa alba B18LD]|uniref:Cell division protein FtsQ n=1 Tax=Beggiatoa alba B18LD TaxID=395493 RepID=I3CJE1_9GAMM|nr:FtsQ-type POTRA domain-containing protein [Beggiatoa alba]EIJ43734.1 cell division septal protein [Beggiatoa alba B18LD]
MKKTLSVRGRRTERSVTKRHKQARRTATTITIPSLQPLLDYLQQGGNLVIQGIDIVSPYLLNYWKNILFILFIIGILLGSVFWLQNPHNMPIRTVTIEGNQRVSTQSIREAVAPYVTGGLWQVNESAIQTALMQIAWIATVQIEPQWMDTLLIKIEEHQAVGYWQDVDNVENPTAKGYVRLVSDKGLVFDVPEQPLNLPQLQSAADNTQEAVELYRMANAQLQAKNLEIKAFGCNQRYAWYIILNNGIKLLLGRGGNMSRLQHFLAIYDKLTTQFPLCSTGSASKKSKKPPTTCQPAISKNVKLIADLRYTNGVAVRLAQ